MAAINRQYELGVHIYSVDEPRAWLDRVQALVTQIGGDATFTTVYFFRWPHTQGRPGFP